MLPHNFIQPPPVSVPRVSLPANEGESRDAQILAERKAARRADVRADVGLDGRIALIVGIPAGYGIARTGAHRFTVLILIARMTPALSYLIPLFAVFQFLQLNNTLTALVITHLVITVPIIVYIMASHFETLPRELEEAAEIDSASPWGAFRHVALPVLLLTVLIQKEIVAG